MSIKIGAAGGGVGVAAGLAIGLAANPGATGTCTSLSFEAPRKEVCEARCKVVDMNYISYDVDSGSCVCEEKG